MISALLFSLFQILGVTVAWDPPTDGVTTGYVVSYGTTPGVYPNQMNVGLKLQQVFPNLPRTTTYYFVVQAYDKTGQRSPVSEELIGLPADTSFVVPVNLVTPHLILIKPPPG